MTNMKLLTMYKKAKVIILNSYYSFYYYKIRLNKKLILMESKNGGDLAGNMFHILLELSKPEYKEYTVYLSVLESKQVSIQNQLNKYGMGNIRIIRTNSCHYYKYLATAKYLFTDTSFNRSYVKKEGQVITNTWHGTPLKKMGRDIEDRAYGIGNVQRNLLFADYLVYPNEYMKEKMIEAYMLNELYEGTILNEGYPRNSVFFHKELGQDIKRELGLEDKQVFIYMPTWRGTLVKKNTDHLLALIEYHLRPLDKELKDNQVLYVKLHPFVSKDADYSKYEHIKPYPDQYDTYEFMNMCDCLITDYSSVFYDFANTGKKVILFAYDETEYIRERGLYVSLDSLPFPVVKSVKDLVYELNSSKKYDDTQFLKKCCTYDSPGAAERICKHVIKGEKQCREEKLPRNGKDTVILFGSALSKNGLTTSLINLFNNIDLKKRNYFVTFNEQALKKAPLRLAQIPEEVGIYPMSSGENFTLLEAAAYLFYFKWNKENAFTEKYLDRLYKREWKKHFGNTHFDHAIQFAGYEKKAINLFQRFEGAKTIYVHSDMVAEMKTRDNQHYLTLKNAYQKYDNVAVITRDIVPPTLEISGREDNIAVINNCHAHKEVIRKSKEPMAFDVDTKCNITEQELKKLLAGDKKKFITIGRFSPEKGHLMLMKAFEKFCAEYKDVCLIIIGGHGVLYNQTLEYAKNSEEEIIIIKSIKNPMPILRQCDFFILSSYYEGLGLTLLEADALGIPTMSTDIPGPRGFIKDYNGYLVEASESGLEMGMIAFMKGEVKAMNVDYGRYNRGAVEQFDSLFE